MKQVVLLSIFLFFVTGAFAQYGKLEPLDASKETIFVLRTPESTLKRLQDTTDKVSRRKAEFIENTEHQLEIARQGFLAMKLPTINVQSFLNAIKYLENHGVDVNYYVQEYFYYYPNRRNSR
ncbi:hypothetical protein [Desertivirga arenae]|uniref:hypothetical protein n=1 Tax=Desertivirga arenae TaxID=2810309 RepID=UPI001A97ACC8|nr:hypothetical protein [Pedobacter sp. SYSU D00823]